MYCYNITSRHMVVINDLLFTAVSALFGHIKKTGAVIVVFHELRRGAEFGYAATTKKPNWIPHKFSFA